MDVVQSYDICSVERSEVLRYLGYAGQEISPELDARVDAMMEAGLLDEARDLMRRLVLEPIAAELA